jgi:cob(I)alamin adenosyltransferase
MRTASIESRAFVTVDRGVVRRAARRIAHAMLDEVMTLVMLTGVAAILFIEFS